MLQSYNRSAEAICRIRQSDWPILKPMLKKEYGLKMLISISILWSDLWSRLSRKNRDQEALDVLQAFIRDAEHELLALVTALKAHIDLLNGEQLSNIIATDRFLSLNRAIARLTIVTDFLASISEQTQGIQTKQKIIMEQLMQKITTDTSVLFGTNQVSLSYNIAGDAQLFGQMGPLKTMITLLALVIFNKCHKHEIINITGLLQKKCLSLLFSTDLDTYGVLFKPWQLGNLRQIPTNGEGIGLAAVSAMARLCGGQLSVGSLPDDRHEYKLVFGV